MEKLFSDQHLMKFSTWMTFFKIGLGSNCICFSKNVVASASDMQRVIQLLHNWITFAIELWSDDVLHVFRMCVDLFSWLDHDD